METIQYSLKKNSTYSIDFKSIPNKMLLNKTSTKLNNIFDKHCLETYGNKTCILFELDDDTIEIRLLDKLYQLKLYQLKYTGKNKLYIVIPSLLEKLYTVVLVQMIQKTNAKEIVAIHFPSN